MIPHYAAALAVMFVALSLLVIRERREQGVSLGTRGVAALERRVRAHANFAEYVPFALLLLAMAEWRGAHAVPLHLAALCLVGGRVAHAWGVSRADKTFTLRVVGMALTFAAILLAAALLVLA